MDKSEETFSALPQLAEESNLAVYGDKIQGDKFSNNSIQGGVAAFGRDARATLNQYTSVFITAENYEDQPPLPGEPPYKGLAYFTEADKGLFFGREKLSSHITDRLHTTHFLALIGASGSGKSSLLRAGIIPQLRHHNWQIRIIKPGIHPLTALANSLTQDDPALTAAAEIQQALATNPNTLHLAAAKIATQHNAERLLLAVDQFEELFTQCKDTAERTAFVQNLLAAVNAEGATTVLVSVRADFYDRIAEFDDLRQLLSQQQEFIGPMSQDELVRAILEPAQCCNWRLVEGLTELIVQDVGREPGRLPLLSHALFETWLRRRGNVLTLGGYHEAGGVEGAIAHTAEETLTKLSPEQVEVARELFLNLTELGEGAEDTRRVVSQVDLSAVVDESELDNVLETLVRARLITVGGGEIEVAHEALIRRWPTLQEWLADNRERLRFERQIARDAKTWANLDCDEDVLYRGARLAEATERVESGLMKLAEQPAAFLVAGRELADRQARELEAQRQRELEQQRLLTAEQKQRADVEALSARRLRLGLVAAGILVVVLATISIILIVPIIQEKLAIRDARTESVEIKGGTAVIGTDLMTADPDEREEINPRISTFQMEIYEVSNKQYQLCVDKGDCSAPVDPEMFLNKLLSAHPVVNVTAAQANTYCKWIGRRLPTELEWEYAARSEAGYEWPWSWKNPDLKKEEACPTGTSTNPINNDFGNDTKEGVRNLCGNVWEWTSSIHTAMGYKEGQEIPYWDGDSLALVDLVLVQRGGSFAASIKTITDRRQALPFGGASLDVGFRCVSN